jgi:hypothetical protein
VSPWLTTLATDAWHVFGVGIGQSEIIGFGLVAGTTIVVGYRLFTRGKRYRHE